MEHFDTLVSYLHFGLCRNFSVNIASSTPYHYTQNNLEKVGNFLSRPVLGPLDFSVRNGRNPLFILALTVVGVFTATMLFYPAVIAQAITPLALLVIKTGSFIALQSAILGLGLRTLGRLNNPELMKAWDNAEIVSNRFGSVRI